MGRNGILGIFIVLLVLACKEEEMECKLGGKWYFDTVMRNDRVTNTLQFGFFDFKTGDKFNSNIFDEEEDYNYTIQSKTISIQTEEKFDLTIQYCSNDTLILSGEMSAFKMDFLLTRNPKVDSLDLRSINPLENEENPDDQLY